MGRFMYWTGTHPPEGPPICTALNALPLGIPPPISKTTSLMVTPMGTSTKPVLFTLPANEKIFVPLLFSVPTCRYHAALFLILRGTFAQVSTLLMFVGL